MPLFLNIENLNSLLQDFYTTTGLRAVVLDENGNFAAACPRRLPGFCRELRKSEEALKECILCDRTACIEARKKGGAVVYRCHAGLAKAAAPVVAGGKAAAYVILSGIMQDEDKTAGWRQVAQCCGRYGLQMQLLNTAYGKLPYTAKDAVLPAARLLAALVEGQCYKSIEEQKDGALETRLNTYITKNLKEDLSGEALCTAFGISRTKLYRLAMQCYGRGISEHINTMRMQKAARLLLETSMPNSEIAEEIGIHDYNYFSKLFKKETGFSPRQYRQSMQELKPL